MIREDFCYLKVFWKAVHKHLTNVVLARVFVSLGRADKWPNFPLIAFLNWLNELVQMVQIKINSFPLLDCEQLVYILRVPLPGLLQCCRKFRQIHVLCWNIKFGGFMRTIFDCSSDLCRVN